jgi:tRNA 2-thiouridine synthesizing protein A
MSMPARMTAIGLPLRHARIMLAGDRRGERVGVTRPSQKFVLDFCNLASGRREQGRMDNPSAPTPSSLSADEKWDAGDLGCGPLVLELRKRLRKMPGRLLKVRALDPAEPIDLPAWCRLTGNELLHHDAVSKSFWIKSRANW